jgi:hypothetical protein
MSSERLLSYEPLLPKSRELRTLRRLSLTHYVAAVLSLIEQPGIYVGLYLWVRHVSPGRRAPSISISGFLDFVGPMPMVPATIGYACFAGLAALSGWFISRRRFRTASILIGCALCLCLPFGICAGLPAIILLRRRNIKESYRYPNLDSRQDPVS